MRSSPISELGGRRSRLEFHISSSHKTFLLSKLANVSEPRHGDSDRLHVRMADTDIHTLDPRLLRCGLGIAVQLTVSSA